MRLQSSRDVLINTYIYIYIIYEKTNVRKRYAEVSSSSFSYLYRLGGVNLHFLLRRRNTSLCE